MLFTVRLAAMQDIPALAAVELLAAERFNAEALTQHLTKNTVPSTKLEASCRKNELWVAESEERRVVGFLLAERLDDDFHISEMSVVPDHGRQGIGAALINAAVTHMRAAGYKRITLTSFASVPWNGPFYLKQGFRVMRAPEIGVGLSARIEQERVLGLINRVVMCRSEA
jgi:ribosomal protein S18 acetylase RimI-like enzyme